MTMAPPGDVHSTTVSSGQWTKVHRRERVKVDAGEFDCLVVEPILRGPGLFNQKGRLTVWVTDDKYKMPVLMRSRVVIGHVSAILKEYTLAR